MHASLDLLVDGERGLWHLANQGAVTWHEFGRMVALAAGLPEELVVRCRSGDIWQPARRPAYSALGSARGLLMRPLEDAVAAYAADASAGETCRVASS